MRRITLAFNSASSLRYPGGHWTVVADDGQGGAAGYAYGQLSAALWRIEDLAKQIDTKPSVGDGSREGDATK